MNSEHFMLRALALARKGAGLVRPNPLVGAVVVNESGNIVGAGFHEGPGKRHGEVVALDEAGEAARGAVLYVTLEPCNHFGRTPPCTKRIIEAGIKKVVFAVSDPNTEVKGGGEEAIKAAGIEVEKDVLQDAATSINAGWFKWTATKRPFVVLKQAVSCDGFIGKSGQGQIAISGSASRAQVQRLRRWTDAVVVGVDTVIEDNPLLSNRTGRGKQPLRVVLDSKLRIPTDAEVLRDYALEDAKFDPQVIVFTTSHCDVSVARRLGGRGVSVEFVAEENEKVSVKRVLETLGARGVQSVLIEAGKKLGNAVLEQGLADVCLVYQSKSVKIVDGVKASECPTKFGYLKRCERSVGGDVLSVYSHPRSSEAN